MSLFSDINTWDVGKTLEKVENHSTFSHVLPTSRVFISENRDMVNVFYCLNANVRRTSFKPRQHNTIVSTDDDVIECRHAGKVSIVLL